jgi:GLPGLI family protein
MMPMQYFIDHQYIFVVPFEKNKVHMKKLMISGCLLLISAIGLRAQMSEGHVSYTIEATTDNPDMQMAVGMLQGSTMEVYFKDKQTRSEMKMGAMMTITTVTDESTKEVLMLMSGMMGNTAVKSTIEELDQRKEEQPEYEVTLIDETKEISGYLCKKAIITTEGMESVFWYTDQISVAKGGQSYLNSDVPGYPMQFEINNQGMKMTMTVVKVEDKLDKKKAADLFKMEVPSGYKEMTLEDLGKMGM